jgi:hypothetical protein
LKEIVQGVFGLDNRRVARRRRHPVPGARTPYYGALGAQFIGHRFPLAADIDLKAEKHHMLTSSGYADWLCGFLTTE